MNRNPWVESLFRPLAIGVMSGCIALSSVGLVRLFAPTWNGTYLVAGCVLAALEANYSYQLIRARQLRGADVLRFRTFEIATFFILLKIGGYAGDRWADVLADVKTWPRQPFNILGAETAVAFILALLSWQASTQTARDLEQIGEPPERHRHYVPPMEKLTGRFFWGGAALLIVAGITRIGIAALLDMGRPSVPGLVLNVLVYFLPARSSGSSSASCWRRWPCCWASSAPRTSARSPRSSCPGSSPVALVLPPLAGSRYCDRCCSGRPRWGWFST